MALDRAGWAHHEASKYALTCMYTPSEMDAP